MKRQTKPKYASLGPIIEQPPCKLARKRLLGPPFSKRRSGFRITELFSWGGIALDADWVQRHVATCPRCQRRFSALGKVHVGLSLLKSQAHSLDLLNRANAEAVAVLHRDLRQAPKAQHLSHLVPHPTLREKIRLYKQAFSQIAACFVLLTLSKISVFSSLKQTQKQGQIAVKHYYQVHLDDDITDDLFAGRV
jgi:hypothetical protein